MRRDMESDVAGIADGSGRGRTIPYYVLLFARLVYAVTCRHSDFHWLTG